MTYVWLTWLADALRSEGCDVREYDGWKNRGRPSSTGAFNPYAVDLHHTGTKTSHDNPAPTLSTCVHGRSDLPGPLCQVLIDYNGVCHVIAAGRANHAGECNGDGPTSPGDGNAQMVGFELDYSGSQPVSDEQGDATIRATAAVLRRFNRDASYVRGHKETSTTGKWDPGRNGSNDPAYKMSGVRELVADRLADGNGDDVALYVSLGNSHDITVNAGAERLWPAWDVEHADKGNTHGEGWASIRPPEDQHSAVLEARLNLAGLPPNADYSFGFGVYDVDDDSGGVQGRQDVHADSGGNALCVITHVLAVNHGKYYRVELSNPFDQNIKLKANSEFRALLFG